MTYPRYPGFEPHIVLDWESYDRPEDQIRFASMAPVDLMRRIRDAYGNWVRQVELATPFIALVLRWRCVRHCPHSFTVCSQGPPSLQQAQLRP